MGIIDLEKVRFSSKTIIANVYSEGNILKFEITNKKEFLKEQTMISHNNGDTWQLLRNGELILFGKSSDKFAPIFTDENLHGILLANSTDKN